MFYPEMSFGKQKVLWIPSPAISAYYSPKLKNKKKKSIAANLATHNLTGNHLPIF